MSTTTNDPREMLMRATSLEEIATATKMWRNINPDAFHTPKSLGARMFLDQPIRELPYLSFIRPALQLADER